MPNKKFQVLGSTGLWSEVTANTVNEVDAESALLITDASEVKELNIKLSRGGIFIEYTNLRVDDKCEVIVKGMWLIENLSFKEEIRIRRDLWLVFSKKNDTIWTNYLSLRFIRINGDSLEER